MSQSDERHQQNHDFLLGELLAATRATKDALSELAADQKDQSKALATCTTTLDHVVRTVENLSHLVKHKDGNGDSLLTRVRLIEEGLVKIGEVLAEGNATFDDLVRRESLEAVIKSAAELASRVESLENNASELNTAHNRVLGGWAVVLWIGGGLGWLITTGLALYAALK